jgi:altronate hydrolase
MRGYLRKDGRKGLRNQTLVVYLVECAQHVAKEIVSNFQNEEVQLIGFGGCAPSVYADFIMKQLCTHPNVGGVLLVSLGCENFDRKSLHDFIAESGRPVNSIIIQENNGTKQSINVGISYVKVILEITKESNLVPFDFRDLTVGAICGGSDATSGITANPSVGKAFDVLISMGAKCIFEEPGELIGCEQMLAERAINPELADKLIKTILKADKYYKKMGCDSFSAGNAVGGLTTIEEKSLGSYCKSGTSIISGLINPGQIPTEAGLYFMDVVPDGDALWGFPNPNDNSEIVEMIASGAQIILFTTGRGSVVGSAISPLLKICANPQTYNKLKDDMDINAGKIIDKGATIQDISDEILVLIESLASGELSKSEKLKHKEFVLGYKFFDYSDPINCSI